MKVSGIDFQVPRINSRVSGNKSQVDEILVLLKIAFAIYSM